MDQRASLESQELVRAWSSERIAKLQDLCSVPRSRLAALLGIGISALSALAAGRYTPSPALCRRFEQLQQMAERGELHGEYVPAKAEMQRRMTLFRAWWFARDPTAEFPLISIAVKVRWGRERRNELVIPVETLPQLRLTKWDGLVQVIRAVTTAVRSVARVGAKALWKDADAEFWQRYARDTVPAIVNERAAREIETMKKAREAKK